MLSRTNDRKGYKLPSLITASVLICWLAFPDIVAGLSLPVDYPNDCFLRVKSNSFDYL